MLLTPSHGFRRRGSDNDWSCPLKQCTGCKDFKPFDQFGKHATHKDGLQSQCKECRVPYSAEYYATHRGDILAVQRVYRAANLEKILVGCAEYYAKNSDAICGRARARHAASPERLRVYDRDRYVADPSACSRKTKRRRALRKGCDVLAITAKDYRRIMSALCYLCGIAPSATEEHIIPLSRGGRHSIGNLLGACGSCNSRKGTKLLAEYKRQEKLK